MTLDIVPYRRGINDNQEKLPVQKIVQTYAKQKIIIIIVLIHVNSIVPIGIAIVIQCR